MSRTIDERIVQMTFNNSDFEKNAKTTISTLDTLNNKLDFSDSERGLNILERSFRNLDLSGITRSFSALETIAVGALLNIGRKAEDTAAKLVKSLSIDNISAGWRKYDERTQSVQTLVNSTGKSVEEIETYLSKLMWYSDETSFGFTDMTKALATMVSSGGDIDKLIPMIEGIGNATAYAGKGAAEFQRVIYNLNQSYSMGYLNTQDWKSIELAGVNSKALKEQLIAAGKALGTIKDKSKGLEDFKSLLSGKVFTKEVMERAFSSFAEMTEEAYKLVDEGKFDLASDAIEYLSGQYSELAESSFKAAQTAKSFQEVIDATKDAVSSKWMETFNLIFGNYDQAKALWTDMVEDFYTIFAKGGDSRNSLLTDWKQMWITGTENSKKIRDNFIMVDEALTDGSLSELTMIDSDALTQTQAIYWELSRIILGIRNAIKEIWENTFDPITAKGLFKFVEGIRKWLINIADNVENMSKSGPLNGIYKILQGITNAVKTVFTIGKSIVSDLINPVISLLKPVLNEILDIFGDIGQIITNTVKPMADDMSPFQKILSNIVDIIKPLVDILASIVHWIHEMTSSFASSGEITIFSKAFDFIGKIFDTLNKLISGTVPLLSKFKTMFSNVFKYVGKVFNNLFTNLNDILSNADFSTIGFGLLFAKIFESIFGGSGGGDDEGFFSLITNIVDKFKKGLSTVSKALEDLPALFEKLLSPVKDALKAVWTKEMGEAIKNLSLGLLAISFAILIIASIPNEDLGKAMAAVTLLSALMAALLKLIDSMNNKKMTSFKNVFGSKKGIFGKIGSFATLLQTSDIAVSVVAIASSMVIISGALKIVSSIPKEALWTGLLALLVMTGAVFAFIYGISKLESSSYSLKNRNGTVASETGGALKGIGKAVEQIAFGLLVVSAALKVVSTINPTSLIWSVGALSIMLGAIGLFVTAVGKLNISKKNYNSLKGLGKTFEQISLGMLIIAGSLKLVSGISPDALVNSIAALSAVLLEVYLLVLGLSAIEKGLSGGKSLNKIAGSMLVMSVAIGALAGALGIMALIPLEALKKGVKYLAIAFTEIWTFCALMSTVGKGTGDLLGIASSMLIFSAALGVMGLALAAIGMINFTNLVGSIVAIGALMTVIGFVSAIFSSKTIIAGILAFSAAFVAIGAGVYLVCAGLEKLVPLLMLLSAQSQEISLAIQNTLMSVFAAILGVIPDFVVALVGALLEFVAALISGLAQKVPELLNALFDILVMLVNGLADLVRSRGGELGQAIGNLVEALMEGFIKAIGGFIDGFFGTGSLISGFLDKMFGDRDAGEALFGTVIATGGPAASDAGSELDTKMAEAIQENKEVVTGAATDLGTEAAESMDASEEAEESANNTVLGFVNFLNSGTATGLVSNAFSGLGQVGIGALKTALGIQSPSKVMAEQGMFSVLGLVRGVYDNLNSVDEAGTDTANTLLNAIKYASDNAESILEDDLSPVITPVLDMSDIENNAGQISSLLGNGSSYKAALSVSQANSVKGIQNGLGKPPVSISVGFTINKAGNELTEADFIKYGNQIANIVNEKLGEMI